MFKPNIRGHPRSDLRFSARGWISISNQELVILHRVPWRRSWLHQLDMHEDPILLVSRDRRVHLQIKRTATSKIPSAPKLLAAGSKPLMLIMAFVAATLAVFFGFGSAFQVQETNPVSLPKVESGSRVLSCADIFSNFADIIQKWNSQVPLPPTKSAFEISRVNRSQLGGVRSSLIDLNCDGEINQYRLSEVRQASGWKFRSLDAKN